LDFITAPYAGNQQMGAEGETGNSPHSFTLSFFNMALMKKKSTVL